MPGHYASGARVPALRSRDMHPGSGAALSAYVALFAALYAGFGVQSPYLPALLKDHGLDAGLIGAVLAAGTAIRLAAGPAAARFADRRAALRPVFAFCAAAAALA